MTQEQPPITVHACHKCHYAVVDGTPCRFCEYLVPVAWEVQKVDCRINKHHFTTYIPIYPSNTNNYAYTESTS